MTKSDVKNKLLSQVISPTGSRTVETIKSKIPDLYQILELAKSSPSELVKMAYHGKDAGIELKSQDTSVGPLQRLFIIISLVMSVIMLWLIYAKEYTLFLFCLKLWLASAGILAIIYCTILITKPELMNNWHLLIKVIEQNFFGDNYKGHIGEGDQEKVYQPAEIVVNNKVKANINAKKEISK